MSNDGSGSFLERVKLIAAIALAVLVLVVMVQNRESINVYLLFVNFTMPKAILVLLTFVLGVGTGYLLSWWRSHRRN